MKQMKMLSSGELTIEFQPKYHIRAHLKQILRTAFPHDFNFEEFESIEPQDDPNGSIWFMAYMNDEPDQFGNYTEWTFYYENVYSNNPGIINVPVDEFKFEEYIGKRDINQFLKKYANV